MSTKSPNEGAITDIMMVITSLEEGVGPMAAVEFGLRKTMLSDAGRRSWDFVEEYTRDHGKLPPPEALCQRIGWSPNALDKKPDLTFKYVCQLIIERTVVATIQRMNVEVAELLSNNEPLEARDLVRRFSEELNDIGNTRQQVVEMFSLYPEVEDLAHRYRDGMVGVTTSFPTIDEFVGGFHLGHTHYFLARPASGKTWILCKQALHVYEQNYRCLFVSSEMPAIDIATRMVCIQNGISYEQFKDGNLDDEAMERLHQAAERYKDNKDFKLIDDSTEMSKDVINAIIDRFDPDFLFIDSFYKLGQGRDLNSRVQDAVPFIDSCKRRGRSRGVVCTGQLGRTALQTEETTTIEAIYGSDAVGQDAETIYGIWSDKEMRRDNQLGMKQLKARGGKDHEPFYVSFDMENMRFDQLEGVVASRANVFDSQQKMPGKYLGANGLQDGRPKQGRSDVVESRVGGGASPPKTFNPSLKY